MKTRLMLFVTISSICFAAYALTPSDAQQPSAPSEGTVSGGQASTTQESDTAVEVRNNNASTIFVIQKGVKQEVASKATYLINDATTFPLSITPTSGNPAIKYVTLARKGGACKFATCLVVQ
ncbi:hypothetical protein [Pseudomonas sp. UBA1879]|uniref:hypothetical protein n=1 Tax=Pseudomonas sp. UBA1879 TaxID=1947305 RepID=UPI0025D74A8E|nr:hypothetical protein [Pseudomonas sp. UBA1879]